MKLQASDLGRTRIRELGTGSPIIRGTENFYLFGNLIQSLELGGGQLRGRETTVDATHPWFFELMKPANRKFLRAAEGNVFFNILHTGGDFSSTKQYFLPGLNGQKVSLGKPGGNSVTYNGWVLPAAPDTMTQFTPSPISDDVLKDIGARQMRYSDPKKPIVDLGQDIAEFKREGLPSFRSLLVLRNFLRREYGTEEIKEGINLDNIAKEHLNYQFGWRPVISDIYAAARAANTLDKKWAKLKARGERLQRIHFDLPVEHTITTETVAVGGTVYPNLSLSLCSGQSSALSRTREVVTTRKFSASYMYHIPEAHLATRLGIEKILQYQKQYGLSIDPALIWELTPWSWLVDWFLPMGNFLKAVDSSVLGTTVWPWAYVSEHSVYTDTFERPGAVLSNGVRVAPVQVVYDYKRRIGANPFGFGLSWGDLSPLQLSLLTAVGITR